MPDCMIDLETLGTRPGCAILSIGAVVFDRHTGELGPEFYIVVNRASCKKHGLFEEQSTLDWWARQSHEARKVLAEAETAENGLGGALVQFTAFLQKFGKKDLFLWGNGADFDQPIITHCYAAIGHPLPFLYCNNRCFRTLRSLVSAPSRPRDGVHHNALDDAKWQAKQAIEYLKKIEQGSRISMS